MHPLLVNKHRVCKKAVLQGGKMVRKLFKLQGGRMVPIRQSKDVLGRRKYHQRARRATGGSIRSAMPPFRGGSITQSSMRPSSAMPVRSMQAPVRQHKSVASIQDRIAKVLNGHRP